MTREELAEDTATYLVPRRGRDMLDRGGLVYEAGPLTAIVQRIRLGDVDDAVDWARRETRRRGIPRLEWWIGPRATPADLAERLRAHGFVPDEVPELTGMTCDAEPPPGPGDVEVCRIRTLDEQLEAVAVDWEVWAIGAEERAQRVDVERARFDPDGPVHHFVARVDGRAVGFGRAIDMDGGVAMMGGAVLPAYRGRGVYRALVRARWEHAAARGTPLLVVQAGEMSAPVLDGLGFVRHGVIRLFVDPGVASGHGDDGDQHRAR